MSETEWREMLVELLESLKEALVDGPHDFDLSDDSHLTRPRRRLLMAIRKADRLTCAENPFGDATVMEEYKEGWIYGGAREWTFAYRGVRMPGVYDSLESVLIAYEWATGERKEWLEQMARAAEEQPPVAQQFAPRGRITMALMRQWERMELGL